LPLSSVSAVLNSSIWTRGSGIYGLLHLACISADTFTSVNSAMLTKSFLFVAAFSRDAESPCGPSRKISAVERQSVKIIHVPQDAGILDEIKEIF